MEKTRDDSLLWGCITGLSNSGICGNRACCVDHGVQCCGECDKYYTCNSACGWHVDSEKEAKEDE